MIRPLIVGLAVLAIACATPAQAGSVSGRIRLGNSASTSTSPAAGDKEGVVIWLEGQAETKPPETPVKISQRNLQFAPNFIVAVKGQRVDMPNDDDVAHNVYSFTGMNQFNLGIYAKGEFRSVTFDKTGIVDLFCSIHHQMHARIFVVPTRYFASSMPGQAFTISDVPPGRYVMKAWHQRSRMMERTIVVPKTGTVTQNVVLEDTTTAETTAQK
ncbi:MAG TPA: plastocyanin/azurin family copper-binding protein [Candidatus Limnocylindrales bacterium]|nr:plastocyanin/azurin family copper-binding protein [Candidatus Limnocylindrales bacterium]